MDILAHGLYSVVLCGKMRASSANASPCFRVDRQSAMAAVAFGLLPDIVSMGPAFLGHIVMPAGEHFFAAYGGRGLVVYRLTHSLIVSLGCAGLVWLFRRPLFLPSLAWPLHVICDMFTHSASKFRTTIFYPLSSWGFDGPRWWEHPEVVAAYWGILGFLWLARMRLTRHISSRDCRMLR